MEDEISVLRSQLVEYLHDLQIQSKAISKEKILFSKKIEDWTECDKRRYGDREQLARTLESSKQYKEQLNHSLEMTLKVLSAPRDIGVEQNEAFATYMATAELLKDKEEVHRIIELFQQVKSDKLKEDRTPFIFIYASGMGKTQMSFNLVAAGVKLRHLYCWKHLQPNKPVHRAFEKRSSSFLDALNRDLKECGKTDAIEHLKLKECYLYGFIYALLDETSYYPNEKRTIHDVLQLINDKKLDDTVIYLDEFPKQITNTRNYADDNTKELRMMRDVFRLLGLVTIVSSDSSCSANLEKFSITSRSDPIVKWCYVVGRLPKFVASPLMLEELEKVPDYLRPLLEYILGHSRGLFINTALRFLRDNHHITYLVEFLDRLTTFFFETITGEHNLTWMPSFALGQLCLACKGNAETLKTEHVIYGHFANLNEAKVTPLEMVDKSLKVTSNKKRGLKRTFWQTTNENRYEVIAKFPKVEDEIMLYLAFSGWKYASQQYPTQKYTKHFCLSSEIHQLRCSSVGLTSDGTILECISSGSIVVASRCQGLGGCHLGPFLQNLFFQLGITNSLMPKIDISMLNQNVFANSFKIPYLSIVNSPFPREFLDLLPADSSHIQNFGSDLMPGQVITGRTEDGSVTFDCKYLSKELCSLDLLKIIHGIPDESTIHFLLVNKLRTSGYFNEYDDKLRRKSTIFEDDDESESESESKKRKVPGSSSRKAHKDTASFLSEHRHPIMKKLSDRSLIVLTASQDAKTININMKEFEKYLSFVKPVAEAEKLVIIVPCERIPLNISILGR